MSQPHSDYWKGKAESTKDPKKKKQYEAKAQDWAKKEKVIQAKEQKKAEKVASYWEKKGRSDVAKQVIQSQAQVEARHDISHANIGSGTVTTDVSGAKTEAQAVAKAGVGLVSQGFVAGQQKKIMSEAVKQSRSDQKDLSKTEERIQSSATTSRWKIGDKTYSKTEALALIRQEKFKAYRREIKAQEFKEEAEATIVSLKASALELPKKYSKPKVKQPEIMGTIQVQPEQTIHVEGQTPSIKAPLSFDQPAEIKVTPKFTESLESPTEQVLGQVFPHPRMIREGLKKQDWDNGLATGMAGTVGFAYGLSRFVAGLPNLVLHPKESIEGMFDPKSYTRYGELLRTDPSIVMGEVAGMWLLRKAGGRILKPVTSKIGTGLATRGIINPKPPSPYSFSTFTKNLGSKPFKVPKMTTLSPTQLQRVSGIGDDFTESRYLAGTQKIGKIKYDYGVFTTSVGKDGTIGGISTSIIRKQPTGFFGNIKSKIMTKLKVPQGRATVYYYEGAYPETDKAISPNYYTKSSGGQSFLYRQDSSGTLGGTQHQYMNLLKRVKQEGVPFNLDYKSQLVGIETTSPIELFKTTGGVTVGTPADLTKQIYFGQFGYVKETVFSPTKSLLAGGGGIVERGSLMRITKPQIESFPVNVPSKYFGVSVEKLTNVGELQVVKTSTPITSAPAFNLPEIKPPQALTKISNKLGSLKTELLSKPVTETAPATASISQANLGSVSRFLEQTRGASPTSYWNFFAPALIPDQPTSRMLPVHTAPATMTFDKTSGLASATEEEMKVAGQPQMAFMGQTSIQRHRLDEIQMLKTEQINVSKLAQSQFTRQAQKQDSGLKFKTAFATATATNMATATATDSAFLQRVRTRQSLRTATIQRPVTVQRVQPFMPPQAPKEFLTEIPATIPPLFAPDIRKRRKKRRGIPRDEVDLYAEFINPIALPKQVLRVEKNVKFANI